MFSKMETSSMLLKGCEVKSVLSVMVLDQTTFAVIWKHGICSIIRRTFRLFCEPCRVPAGIINK